MKNIPFSFTLSSVDVHGDTLMVIKDARTLVELLITFVHPIGEIYRSRTMCPCVLQLGFYTCARPQSKKKRNKRVSFFFF